MQPDQYQYKFVEVPSPIRVRVRLLKILQEHHQYKMVQMIREEIEYNGVSVIIPHRPCIQRAARLKMQPRQE